MFACMYDTAQPQKTRGPQSFPPPAHPAMHTPYIHTYMHAGVCTRAVLLAAGFFAHLRCVFPFPLHESLNDEKRSFERKFPYAGWGIHAFPRCHQMVFTVWSFSGGATRPFQALYSCDSRPSFLGVTPPGLSLVSRNSPSSRRQPGKEIDILNPMRWLTIHEERPHFT